MDTVVHLGAAAGDRQTPEDLLRSNVMGTYNVFEAAKRAGVKRVIFASSGATVSGAEREPPLSHIVNGRYEELGSWSPLTHETPLRPGGLYGATKVWGEALCSYYADREGLSCIAVRIGAFGTPERLVDCTDSRLLTLWVSHDDLTHLFERCIEAPESVRFLIVQGVSDNQLKRMDISNAREVLGYDPKDNAFQISRKIEMAPRRPNDPDI